MIALAKKGSRKFLSVTFNTKIGIYPLGVGGLPGSEVTIAIYIGEYRVFISEDHLKELNTKVTSMLESIHSKKNEG